MGQYFKESEEWTPNGPNRKPSNPTPPIPNSQNPNYPYQGNPYQGNQNSNYPNQGNPYQGNQRPNYSNQGNPYQGNQRPNYPNQGNPYQGNQRPNYPNQGNPYQGNQRPNYPPQGNPYQGNQRPNYPHPGNPYQGNQRPSYPPQGNPYQGNQRPNYPNQGNPYRGNQNPNYQNHGYRNQGYSNRGYQEPIYSDQDYQNSYEVFETEHERNGFVTFWLWLGIIAGAIFLVICINSRNMDIGIGIKLLKELFSQGLSNKLLLFLCIDYWVPIIIWGGFILGNTQLLRWNRGGFWTIVWMCIINVAAGFYLMSDIPGEMIPTAYYIRNFVAPIVVVVIWFAVLQIKQNEKSCWEQLE